MKTEECEIDSQRSVKGVYLAVKEQLDLIITDSILNSINKTIEDIEFKQTIIKEVERIKKNGTLQVNRNKIFGEYKLGDINYYFELVTKFGKTTFSLSTKYKRTVGVYIKEPSRTIIYNGSVSADIYEDIEYEKSNNKLTLFDVRKESVIHIVDKNNIEYLKYEERARDNYFFNKETLEKILTPPDALENYTEKEYFWRRDNYILNRTIKKYIYPENSESFIPLENLDYYAICKDYFFPKNRIPFSGQYYGITSEEAKRKLNLTDNYEDEIQKIKTMIL